MIDREAYAMRLQTTFAGILATGFLATVCAFPVLASGNTTQLAIHSNQTTVETGKTVQLSLTINATDQPILGASFDMIPKPSVSISTVGLPTNSRPVHPWSYRIAGHGLPLWWKICVGISPRANTLSRQHCPLRQEWCNLRWNPTMIARWICLPIRPI